jgi:hypothetical protein
MVEWNKKNKPPLGLQDLKEVAQGILKREEAKRSLARQEQKEEPRDDNATPSLKDLVTDENCQCFHDQHRTPHTRIRVVDHWETVRTESKQMKHWLHHLQYKATSSIPSLEACSSVTNLLCARGLFEGEQYKLSLRVSRHEGAILIDRCDPLWTATRITAKGIERITDPPIIFRRYPHQAAQVDPVMGGDLREFLTLTNLADPSEEVLLLVYIVSCLVPDIPHPIPNFHGPQGSAKTTLARMIRDLVDPSSVNTLSFPENSKELVQMLAHNYMATFDNVTDLSSDRSDTLCRAVTGEGASKRQLYSDDDDIIYTFKHCIGFTGINPTAKNPDLLERSILFRLEHIPEEKRREEQLVLLGFEAMRPRLVGAIFTALSKALAIYPIIQLSRLPRMADFCRWGCAIAEALGYTQEEFLAAYFRNIKEQHQEAIRGSQLACAVISLMEKEESPLEKRSSELYDKLQKIAEEEKLDIKAKDWPKAPNWLLRRLNEIHTNFLEVGITIKARQDSRGTVITIIKTPEDAAAAAMPPQSAAESDMEIVDTLEAAREVFCIPSNITVTNGSTGEEVPDEPECTATPKIASSSDNGDSGSNGSISDTSLPF